MACAPARCSIRKTMPAGNRSKSFLSTAGARALNCTRDGTIGSEFPSMSSGVLIKGSPGRHDENGELRDPDRGPKGTSAVASRPQRHAPRLPEFLLISPLWVFVARSRLLRRVADNAPPPNRLWRAGGRVRLGPREQSLARGPASDSFRFAGGETGVRDWLDGHDLRLQCTSKRPGIHIHAHAYYPPYRFSSAPRSR